MIFKRSVSELKKITLGELLRLSKALMRDNNGTSVLGELLVRQALSVLVTLNGNFKNYSP